MFQRSSEFLGHMEIVRMKIVLFMKNFQELKSKIRTDKNRNRRLNSDDFPKLSVKVEKIEICKLLKNIEYRKVPKYRPGVNSKNCFFGPKFRIYFSIFYLN